MKVNIFVVSVCLLACSLLVSSFIISNAITNSYGGKKGKEEVYSDHALMTKNDLEVYLGLTDEEVSRLLPKAEDDVTASEIPYLLIGDTYYFPAKAIDKWLQETEARHF
ncbi:hypothetical protein [Metabacillus endolithicus]|uniref:Helix-turn-helix domain-containing protein n=1 Tax=Metabacillus endolithicus TaxID=1535204 RepID=A0ABW5BV33_9BACI|nr:hypothetical protein [Metabacillus endolithicus]UPG63398.1 hypothetical protein MVE64_24480 [Metabacillus endolithicus]